MGTVKPISPSEAIMKGKEKREADIPEAMIIAVNELLTKESAKNPNGKIFTLRQDEIIETYLKIHQNFGNNSTKLRDEIFEKGYLNFESLFRKSGWDVTYDKPGYNETYEPTFAFKIIPAERD